MRNEGLNNAHNGKISRIKFLNKIHWMDTYIVFLFYTFYCSVC